MIYIASSWKNDYQPQVVEFLAKHNLDVYDFRKPFQGSTGFHWSEIDPNWESWSRLEYKNHLEGSRLAHEGFLLNKRALDQCTACVLVLPSGRSAHLETGYMIGQGKPAYIYLPEAGLVVPELMYLLANEIIFTLEELERKLR